MSRIIINATVYDPVTFEPYKIKLYQLSNSNNVYLGGKFIKYPKKPELKKSK